jgi:hypothetical protein
MRRHVSHHKRSMHGHAALRHEMRRWVCDRCGRGREDCPHWDYEDAGVDVAAMVGRLVAMNRNLDTAQTLQYESQP